MSDFSKVNKVYLVGIGGIGMSGLAFLLKSKGIKVEGSDIKESFNTSLLKKSNIKVNLGHNPLNIGGDIDLVCFSSAIKEDNPELIEAKRKNIPLVGRAKLLSWVVQDKRLIAVAGSHGKTTTSGLISWVLEKNGINTCGFVGGHFIREMNYAWHRESPLVVVETDESDSSFLEFRPHLGIVTNVDREHISFYGKFEELVRSFKKFIDSSQKKLLCKEDEVLRGFSLECSWYGWKDADITAHPLNQDSKGSSFRCYFRGIDLGTFRINILGLHNILNSLPAIFVGLNLDLGVAGIREALERFPGIRRRLHFRGRVGNKRFYDDYAHHPQEIKVGLEALKNIHSGRIVLLFQPHRYSRLRELFEDFVNCLGNFSGLVVITDIYSAQERPLDGINSQILFKKIKKAYPHAQVLYLRREQMADSLVKDKILRDNDLIVSMGAGDIYKVLEDLIERLREQENAAS